MEEFDDDVSHIESAADADLPDIEEALHGVPQSRDLRKAIVDLDTRLARKRLELVALEEQAARDPGSLATENLKLATLLRKEIARLDSRRGDYQFQLGQKN